MQMEMVILIAAGFCVVIAVLVGIAVYRNMHRKVNFMLDALEDEETAFRYREDKLLWGRFNRSLNRLRSIYEAEIQKISEQDRYYGKMLDSIATGIMAVDCSERGKGSILYMNAAATGILGLPSLSHIRQLATLDPALKEAFEQVSEQRELRVGFANERSKITLSLTAASTSINGAPVKIVTFNDVTGDIVHNEELSWNKLIRVLTHEIMNTVTPIASLSDTLSKDVAEAVEAQKQIVARQRTEGYSCLPVSHGTSNSQNVMENRVTLEADSFPLNLPEFQSGLETIATSSKGLIKFVNNYRNLTRVSPPVKKAFYVRELIDRVCQLTSEQVMAAGVQLSYEEKSEDILLYADASQISQILVNLVKNAVQAGASVIHIEASIDFSERVLITVANNGRPISPESADEIFVPFFTTKTDGSGIGLSLSRQIMRLHNGSITLERSDEKMTVFALLFR